MELLVIQVVFVIVIFIVTFACLLLPIWVFPRDPAKQTGLRSPRVMALCNCMSGGIFLGVCFLGLLPYVRIKFEYILHDMKATLHYPITELCMVLGFFMILLIEQAVHTWQDQKKGTAEMEAMLNFPNEYILYESDSIYTEEESDPCLDEEAEINADRLLTRTDYMAIDSSSPGPALPLSTEQKEQASHTNTGAGETSSHMLAQSRKSRSLSRGSRGSRSRHNRPVSVNSGLSLETTPSHSHSHMSLFENHEKKLRCAVLMLALSIHAVFEGMALGLQENASKLLSLYVAVLIHECLVALGIGISLTKRHIPPGTMIKLGIAFCLMIPVGMAIGMAIMQTQHTAAGAISSAVIQALATGTFIYVIFMEILPTEINGESDRLLKVLFIFLGFVIIACLRVAVKDVEE